MMTLTERRRERQRRAAQPVELTDEQHEAGRLGHPGLTAEEAAYYVHESHRYFYDLELWSRDAMPEDPRMEEQERRREERQERQQFGGRSRRAIRHNDYAKYRTDRARRERDVEVPF